MQGEHLLLVVHIDFDLLLGFSMTNREAVSYLDFLPIFTADAEEGADYTFLVCVTAKGVIKDGKDGLSSG